MTTISVQKRNRVGKGAARATRRENLAPGVIYGNKQDPVAISVDPRIIVKELNTGVFFNTVYEIDVDGKKQKVLPRDVQMHVVKDTVQSIDFLRVNDDTKVKVNIPLIFDGADQNRAVRMGGRLQVVCRELAVIAKAGKIPSTISVNVAEVNFGGIVRISGIELPEGVVANTKDDSVLVSLKAPRGVSSSDFDEDE